MKIYALFSGRRWATYTGASERDTLLIQQPNPPERERWEIPHLVEHHGHSPFVSRRKGEYHATGGAHFFSATALAKLQPFLEIAGEALPVEIEGRTEPFYRFWVTKQVDCLDRERSTIAQSHPDAFGVVMRPVFLEEAWDGSDVFRLPGDPIATCYVSERFVERCLMNRIKGAEFLRVALQPEPIRV